MFSKHTLNHMSTNRKELSLTELDERFDKVEKMMTEITKSKVVIADKEYHLSE